MGVPITTSIRQCCDVAGYVAPQNKFELKLPLPSDWNQNFFFRACGGFSDRVPWDLQKLWLGHANRDVTDRYAEQLKEDVEWRKQEAERAGLGFKLPSAESSVWLLGLPKRQKSKFQEVA
jgi:hypothetical protein